MRTLSALALAAVVLLPAAALGNGGFKSLTAYPQNPKIPMQRALIVHRNGVETLLVESTVETPSPEVGWVLPLPAEPTTLAVGDPGLLASLEACLGPEIDHELAESWRIPLTLLILIGLPGIAVILTQRRKHLARHVGGVFLLSLVLAFFAGLPVVTSSASNGPSLAPGVTVRSSRRVGSYDVSVLQAEAASALSKWLSDNGLSELAADEGRIVDDYITDGWCFLVARLRRERGGTATPHPIQVDFPAAEPIFPMRLTAIGGAATRVELFVVAEKPVEAEGFRCVATDRFIELADSGNDPGGLAAQPYVQGRDTHLAVGHPDAVSLMWKDCFLTHLSADLDPADMGKDVILERSAAEQSHHERVCSVGRRDERVKESMLWALLPAPVFAMVVFGLRAPFRPWKGIGLIVLLAAAAVVGGLTRSRITAVPVRMGPGASPTESWYWLGELANRLRDEQEAGRLHAGLPDEQILEAVRPHAIIDMMVTDTLMKRGRSPFGCDVRRSEAGTYLCFYDAVAREYRIALKPAPPHGEQLVGSAAP